MRASNGSLKIVSWKVVCCETYPCGFPKKSFKTLWILTNTMLAIQRYDSHVDPMGKQIGQRLWCTAYVHQGVKNHFGGSLASISPCLKLSISPRMMIINKIWAKSSLWTNNVPARAPIIILVFISLHIKKKPISIQRYNWKKFRCSNHNTTYKFREVIVFSNTILVVRLWFLQFHYHRENNQTMRTHELSVILRHCCMYWNQVEKS